MTKELELTQGKFALVDDEDYDWLNRWKWYAHIKSKKFYAVRSFGKRPNRAGMYMHRLILNTSKGDVVDHIDGNGLNNQRNNLRLCTQAENVRNQSLKLVNTSGYKGVHWQKNMNKWVARITFNYKKIHLGYFDTPLEASRAYDEKAKELFGEFAKTNFWEK